MQKLDNKSVGIPSDSESCSSYSDDENPFQEFFDNHKKLLQAQESINHTNVETRASNPSTPENENQDFPIVSGSNLNTPSHHLYKEASSDERLYEKSDKRLHSYGELQQRSQENQRQLNLISRDLGFWQTKFVELESEIKERKEEREAKQSQQVNSLKTKVRQLKDRLRAKLEINNVLKEELHKKDLMISNLTLTERESDQRIQIIEQSIDEQEQRAIHGKQQQEIALYNQIQKQIMDNFEYQKLSQISILLYSEIRNIGLKQTQSQRNEEDTHIVNQHNQTQ